MALSEAFQLVFEVLALPTLPAALFRSGQVNDHGKKPIPALFIVLWGVGGGVEVIMVLCELLSLFIVEYLGECRRNARSRPAH